MKKVAALQTQKGPWSRDMSPMTLKRSHSAEGKQTKGFAAHKQTLEEQKGPWNNSSNVISPSSSPSKNDSKQKRMLALQQQKGPWNRSTIPLEQPTGDFNSAMSMVLKSSESSLDDTTEISSDPLPHPPPPPPRHPSIPTMSKAKTLVSTKEQLTSPKEILCFCTAMNNIGKHWTLNIVRFFYKWRRQVAAECTADALAKYSRMRAKEKTEHSVLLWLSTNSCRKLLRNAWKKWQFAVIALQNDEKSYAIRDLSESLRKENEQYKTKLSGIMQKVKNRENMYRHSVVTSTMNSFMRIKTKLALKRRFDAWRRITWQLSYDQALKREKFKMEVGFQAINSEKEEMKKTEAMTVKLKSTLLCLVAFSTWKLKMKELQYRASLEKWAQERKIIQENLLSLQKSLLKLNRSESELVEISRTRGMEMYTALHSMSDKLAKCSSSHSQMKAPGSSNGIPKMKKKLVFEDMKH